MNKVKLGVIGVGEMGMLRSVIAKALPEYELVAIVDKSKMVVKIAGKPLNVNYYTDHNKMLKKEVLDAVAICTPPKSHYQIASDVLDYGINIFCEKTLTISLKNVKEMLKKAENAKVIHQVGYDRRFHPTFRRTKEIIDARIIGDIMHIKGVGFSGEVLEDETEKEKAFKEERFGIFGSMDVHILDLMLWYAGRVKSVFAHAKRKYSSSLDDFVSALCEFNGGTQGIIDFSWSCHAYVGESEMSITIIGTKSTASVNRDFIDLHLKEDAGGYEKGYERIYKAELPSFTPFFLTSRNLTPEMQAFAKALLEGKQANPSWYDGYLVDEMVEGIKISASKGEKVYLPLEV